MEVVHNQDKRSIKIRYVWILTVCVVFSSTPVTAFAIGVVGVGS